MFGLEIWICFVIYQVLRAALLLPVDTLAVELEGLVARVDGHATRALGASVQVQVRGAGEGCRCRCRHLGGEGSLEGVLVPSLHVHEADIPCALEFFIGWDLYFFLYWATV